MRKPLVILAGLVVLAVIAVGVGIGVFLLRDDDANLATEAPQIPTTTAGAVATTSPTVPAGGTPVTLPAGVLHFAIDPAQSSAKYVVREKLSRLPVSSDAVGETSSIAGDLYLSAEGLTTTPASTFKVDLRQLKTDESMRDNYVRSNVLQTSRFPFAEFTITQVTGFPANYAENSEVSVTLSGSMTIHGVTKPVTFAVKARQAGNTLTATADTDFKMSDFGITPPRVSIATSEDGVHVQVVLVARIV